MLIKGVELHNKQKRIAASIISSNAKYYTINASRQAGKSFLLKELLRYYSFNTSNSTLLYITPTYSLGGTFFREFKDSLKDIPVVKEVDKSKLILRLINDTKIIFKSAERYENIRGFSPDYLFLDEFAFFKEGAWAAIKPLIGAKRDSKVIIASTPNGKELFYEMIKLGESDNDRYKSYFMHYTDNPRYDLEEVKDAKKVLPEDVYLTEYEAKFIDGNGTIFKDLETNLVLDSWQKPVTGEKYFAGIDVGKSDSTVLTIINSKGEVVYIKGVKDKAYDKIINELTPALNSYNPVTLVETNGVGDVFFDYLKKSYPRIESWTNNNNNKVNIIEGLVADLSYKRLKLPNKALCSQLENELNTFIIYYTPKTRKITYAARTGFNDDYVMSLAIANKCYSDYNNSVKFISNRRNNSYMY